jgi:NAD(P)-dependent dehydrogenase (short-subunit alcohol dehydrogenase family)
MQLSGKNAVVTGGSRGIGLEICKIFLEQDATVLAVARDSNKLEEAKSGLPGLHTLAADVSAPEEVDRVAAWVQEHWGWMDILVNNAGVSFPDQDDLTTQPDEIFFDTIRINLHGPYLCTKRLLPLLMRSADPRIVNIGSGAGVMSPRLHGSYSVSKVALHAMTIVTAKELEGKVAVNAITPGWVKTDMAPDAPGDPRKSAETALFVVTQPRDVTGRFFRGQAEADWAAF